MDTETEVVENTEPVAPTPTSAPAAKPAKPKKPKATKKKVAAKPKAKKASSSKKKTKAKVAKPKSEKDPFGLRKGSLKSNAAAIYARKNGATLSEVKDKVGSIQLNVLKELASKGFKVKQEKQERKGKRDVTRYYLIAR